MPTNIEIKARLSDLSAARAVAVALGARHYETLDQVDRYFEIDGGRRVKLRTFGAGRAELIRYDRPETGSVRTSEYTVTRVRDDEARARLVPKGEPLVVVRKRREVLLLDNVRIHLDQVEDLGTFLELEAVVDPTHDEGVCRRQVDEILRALGIDESTCIRASYADMMSRNRSALSS